MKNPSDGLIAINPFDVFLSEEILHEVNILRIVQAGDLGKLQAEARLLIEKMEDRKKQHYHLWEEQNAERHAHRLQHAMEQMESESLTTSTLLQEARDKQDDLQFAYIKSFDALLDIRDSRDYLAARRAWDRKHMVKLQPVVNKTEVKHAPITPMKIWATVTGGILLAIFVSGLAAVGWTAIFGLFVLVPIWLFLIRMPEIGAGAFGGGNGPRFGRGV